MTTLFIVRHGRSTANSDGVLAGRIPGVALDDAGKGQAIAAGERLAGTNAAVVVSSPLERTKATAALVSRQFASRPTVRFDRNFTECDYGQWSGKRIAELSKSKLWQEIQERPSTVTFPEGEAMATMASRSTAAVRSWNQRLSAAGNKAWILVSHGDVIKAIIADALGLHLDNFQRINVDPGSISVISYASNRAFVLAVNTLQGDLSRYVPQRGKRPKATVGGSTGK
jgi:probable phosphomutase (TIGR03848 family)